ncbi:Pol [Symbiodinium sp. CCMP2592]|nr:Pol [Symbiodinium sp. CCMP2592]
MDIFRCLSAAPTVADKLDQLCSRGYVITQQLHALHDGEKFNVCLKVVQMDTTHHGLAAVVNLKLPNTFAEGPLYRGPQLTNEEIQIDSSAVKFRLLPQQVYMVVGAKMQTMDDTTYLKLPAFTEASACILLPTREDAVVGIAELFCGGINAWSRAARQLPAYPVLRVDHCGLAIATTLMNFPNEVLFKEGVDQNNFSVFWGEVLDLRWTEALHNSNIEILCASPPSHTWNGKGQKEGFQDSLNTGGWWQLAMVARMTQRRVILVETSLAFSNHQDAKTFDDMMKWAGYQPVWKGKLDSESLTAMDKPKVFMVYWNSADQPSASTPFRMLKTGPRAPVPCEETLWRKMKPELLQKLVVKKEYMAKVTSRELLPPYQKHLTGAPVHIRLVNQFAPMPAVPANYPDLLDVPWPILMKRGMNLPLMEQDGQLRLLSKWEVAKAAGLPGDLILPDKENDAMLLLAQALVPSLALKVLGTAIAHRQEMVMSEDSLLRYFETGCKTMRAGWSKFQLLKPFSYETWETVLLDGATAEEGPDGSLRTKITGLRLQLRAMLPADGARPPPFLPESCRPAYEELIEEGEVFYEHRIYQVQNGYVGMNIDEEASTAKVHKQIAEFLGVPPNLLAVAKVNYKVQEMRHWIVAGEINSQLIDQAIVLVDTGIPQAQWLPTETARDDLVRTYQDCHASYPDSVELNGCQDWKDLDVFDHMNANEDDIPPPPPTPPAEDPESSEGGPANDPEGSDTEPMPDTPPNPPHDPAPDADEQPARGMPFQDAMSPPVLKRPRTDLAMKLGTDEAIAPTMLYYSASLPATVASAFYIKFQGQAVAISNADQRTLQQVVQDEWGVQQDMIYFVMQGKIVGNATVCDRIPVTATVEVRGRLRGGTAAAIKKLRGLLQAKGVPAEALDARVEEVRAHLGDRGIKEAYESFDPWTKIKAGCNFRLVKEAESKAKPRQKEVQKDDADPMQASDPWAAAIRERRSWKIEPSFFRLQDGGVPPLLEKATHGSTGIVLVSEKEAEILAQQQDTMSPNELAVIVIASNLKTSGRFKLKDLEVPCRNGDDNRVLVRAQLLNLGDKEISVAGEDAKVTIEELDGAVLSCEIIRKEAENWDELVDGVVKFLKKRLESLDNALFSTWGRRFFAKGKPAQDPRSAESCFVMLRIKREFRDAILKVTHPGIYLAPRTEIGAPDHTFKVVWFPDKTVEELGILANSEPKAFGLVRNKTGAGIRVKADDYMRLKQRWQPAWKPQDGTPYGLNVKAYYEIQNLPVSCSKNEVQKFLNTVKWSALAIRQIKPRVWLVGAELPPQATIHIAEHGTILITERQAKAQGKGKQPARTIRDMPWLLAGSSMPPASGKGSAPMDLDMAQASDLEDKLQKRIEQLQREQLSAQAMLKEDIGNLKDSLVAHKEQQQCINNELKHGIGQLKIENQAFSQQLTQQLAQISAAIQGQKADFSAELKASQGNLKEELLQQVSGAKRIIHLADELDGHELQNNNYRFCGKCMRQQSYVDDGSRARKSDCSCYLLSNLGRANSFSPDRRILCQWMWYHGTRVGEAKNPGPPGQMRVTGLNVQSLNAFLDDKRILSGNTDLLVCSETCATKFVEQKATKLLHSAGRHVAFGQAVDKRSFVDGRICQTKGKAQGVAVCSVCPLRPCHQPWSMEAWQTSRVMDTYVLVQDQQVRVFAVYGYHQGYTDFQIKNETLLREALCRASTVDIPTLIIGDINCDLQALAVWSDMQTNGWQDAALLQSVHDGRPVEPTFKDSRLDYILFNNKAAPAFRGFFTSDLPETDHRSVNATFDWTALPHLKRALRMPMDMAKLDLPSEVWLHAEVPVRSLDILEKAIQTADATEAWNRFCQTFEETLEAAYHIYTGNCMPSKFKGRGTAKFTHQPAQHVMVKPARHGEFSPSGDESTILLRQRIRQIRRLQTYLAQCLRYERGGLSLEAASLLQTAMAATWRAICSSTGFPPSFRSWWLQEVHEEFPLHMPRAAYADHMLQLLKELEPTWRSVCQRHREARLSSVFAENWKSGGSMYYQAIKPPSRPKVDSLDIPSHHRIQIARSRQKGSMKCHMLDDDLQCVVTGAVWKQGKSSAKVVKIDGGVVHIRKLQGNFTSGDVTQFLPSANPRAILKQAGDFWTQFWSNRRDKGPEDPIITQAVGCLPQLPEIQTTFSESELQWALTALSPRKARGPDGFSNFELKYLPLQLRPALLALLNKFTEEADWPADVCMARMALLYKTDQIGDVSTTRPITVLASILRLWAKLVTKRMLQHVKAHLPETLFGSVPGRSTADMIGLIQTKLESALIGGTNLYGISLDFSKAYNTLPREILEKINKKLGMEKFWRPYGDYLRNLRRFFTSSGNWGEAIYSEVGVPEGCPIAVVQMILVTWLCTAFVDNQSGACIHSYVDDWVLLFQDIQQAPGAVDSLQKLCDSLGLILSLPKSHVFATSVALARNLQGKLQSQGFILGQARNLVGLGVNFQTATQPTSQMREERWLKAKVLLDRLQYMPWTQYRKTQVINRGIFPLIFYGCNTWRAGKDFLREVRAKCNHSVWGKKQYHLHYLSPLFSGQHYEPSLYVARHRFSALLRLFARHEALVRQVWDQSILAKSYFKGK